MHCTIKQNKNKQISARTQLAQLMTYLAKLLECHGIVKLFADE